MRVRFLTLETVLLCLCAARLHADTITLKGQGTLDTVCNFCLADIGFTPFPTAAVGDPFKFSFTFDTAAPDTTAVSVTVGAAQVKTPAETVLNVLLPSGQQKTEVLELFARKFLALGELGVFVDGLSQNVTGEAQLSSRDIAVACAGVGAKHGDSGCPLVTLSTASDVMFDVADIAVEGEPGSDSTTGRVTSLGLEFTPAATPEPSTTVLLGIGLVGIAMRTARRRPPR
jgi:PEP-CTERM motif